MATKSAIRPATLLRAVRASSETQCRFRPQYLSLAASNSLLRQTKKSSPWITARTLHSGKSLRIDILESADKPEVVKQPEQGLQASQATPLSDEDYSERSDKLFEELLEKLEEKSEESGEVDVEYAVGGL